MDACWKRREIPLVGWKNRDSMLYALACALMLLMQAAAGVGPTSVPADQLGDAYLTPNWDLTFGEGEHVEVSCGVFTGGHPENVTIQWKSPNGVIVHSTVDTSGTRGLIEAERMYAMRRDKNYENDSQPGAFSVLTLHLNNVTLMDTGVYLCEYTFTGPTSSTLMTRNIALTVNSSMTVCGFESESLCGWTQDDSTGTMWIRHDVTDVASMERGRALRYDHTYGPGKQIGHFLDMDIVRDDIQEKAVARLVSPVYSAHESHKCFEFWHICHGKNYDHLKIIIQPQLSNGNKTGNETVIFTLDEDMNTTNGEWRSASATIPSQKNPYKIIIEGVMCTEQCRKGTLAIDDLHIHNKSCSENNHTWPDIGLQLRLVDGNVKSEGRVEVLHDGQWGTICSTQFGDKEARVICQALGYSPEQATARRSAHFGSAPDNYMIWLHKVGCQGQEDDLGSCQSKGESWGDTNCTHQDDAAVLCEDPKALPLGNFSQNLVTPTLSSSTATTTTSTAGTTTTAAVSPSTATSTSTNAPSAITSSSNLRSTTLANTPADLTTAATTTTASTTTVTTTTTQPFAPTSPDKQAEEMRTTIVDDTTEEEKDSQSNQTEYETVTIEATMMSPRKKTGAAVGISIILIMLIMTISIYVYRKRKYHKKSKYIVFSNPKYQREHLPSNDMISLDSPLTSGHSILA